MTQSSRMFVHNEEDTERDVFPRQWDRDAVRMFLLGRSFIVSDNTVTVSTGKELIVERVTVAFYDTGKGIMAQMPVQGPEYHTCVKVMKLLADELMLGDDFAVTRKREFKEDPDAPPPAPGAFPKVYGVMQTYIGGQPYNATPVELCGAMTVAAWRASPSAEMVPARALGSLR
jgi:hypothetical protein